MTSFKIVQLSPGQSQTTRCATCIYLYLKELSRLRSRFGSYIFPVRKPVESLAFKTPLASRRRTGTLFVKPPVPFGIAKVGSFSNLPKNNFYFFLPFLLAYSTTNLTLSPCQTFISNNARIPSLCILFLRCGVQR